MQVARSEVPESDSWDKVWSKGPGSESLPRIEGRTDVRLLGKRPGPPPFEKTKADSICCSTKRFGKNGAPK